MSEFRLHNGDCIEVMSRMLENSVDAIVTDPPYGINFMGKAWDNAAILSKSVSGKDHTKTRERSASMHAGEYDLSLKGNKAFEQWTRAWAIEAFRILKPGGHLISFAGSRTYHRMASGIEDAGFEIRDQIMWIYGSGFPKSLNLKGEWQGWGTALKPAHEPMVLARKPVEGTVANNVLTYGVGGLNIDGTRVEGKVPSVPMAEWTRSGTTGATDKRNGELSQPHLNGRWPANVIHDGDQEVLDLFPNTKSGDWKGQQKGVAFNTNENGQPYFWQGDSGSAARFFYCAKASKRDRNEGLDGFEERRASGYGYDIGLGNAGEGMFKDRNPIKKNHHPTVKPTDLMRYLCRLITPPNGIVLDPFMGSGSTGKAAMYENFNFIGIEQSAEYMEIAKARIEFALGDK